MPSKIVKTRNTRTGDHRKIDEWTVVLPGGDKAKFAISIYYDEGVCIFSANSDHPDFQDLRLKSDDINELQAELSEAAEHIIKTSLSSDWSPASQLEIRHDVSDNRHDSRDLRFSLSINLRNIEVHKDRAPGNIPIARVRDDYSQREVVIRSHGDDFSVLAPSSGSLLDPEVKAWMKHPISSEEVKGVGRVLDPGGAQASEALVTALAGFSHELSSRLSPDRIDREGFPEPMELVDMMARAVEPTPSPDEGMEP